MFEAYIIYVTWETSEQWIRIYSAAVIRRWITPQRVPFVIRIRTETYKSRIKQTQEGCSAVSLLNYVNFFSSISTGLQDLPVFPLSGCNVVDLTIGSLGHICKFSAMFNLKRKQPNICNLKCSKYVTFSLIFNLAMPYRLNSITFPPYKLDIRVYFFGLIFFFKKEKIWMYIFTLLDDWREIRTFLSLLWTES